MSKSSLKEKAFRYATGIFVLMALVSLISGLICLEDNNNEYGIVLIAAFLVLLPISIWTYFHPFYPVLLGLIIYLFLVGLLIYSPIDDRIKFDFDGPSKFLVIGLGVILYALFIGYKEWRLLVKNNSVNETASEQSKTVQQENHFRSNQKRSEVAVYLVAMVLGIEVISLILDLFQYELLSSASKGVVITAETANLNDISQQITAIVFLIVYAISAFTFIQWFRRAYFNLHLKVKKVAHTESWAAGSWFVPIINLSRPFQIMKELFHKTEKLLYSSNVDFKKTEKFVILNWWWGLWITSNIVGQFVYRYTSHAETIDQFIYSTIASIFGSLIGIPLAIITIIMIKKYAKMELALEKLDIEQDNRLTEIKP